MLNGQDVEALYGAQPGAVIQFQCPVGNGTRLLTYIAYYSKVKKWHTSAAENNRSVEQTYKTEDLITLLDRAGFDADLFFVQAWKRP